MQSTMTLFDFHKKIKLNAFTLTIAAFLIYWLALLIVCFYISKGILKIDDYERLAWPITFFIHIISLIFFFKVYKRSDVMNRKSLLWLFLINSWLFLVDLFFYIATHANHSFLLQFSFVQFILYYAPCIVYCAFTIGLLSQILLKEVLQINGFIKIISVLIGIDIITVMLFLTSIHYAFDVISWQTISQIILLSFEIVLFSFAIIGLIYSKNKSLSIFLSGVILLVTADFLITYSYISQTTHLLSYGQLLWLLGLMFIMFSALSMNKNKHYSTESWFGKDNMIKNRLAIWFLGASIGGFLLFFIIIYSFSIINKQIFIGLPLFVMLFSIIAVTLAIFVGKNFEYPFKRIENNIKLLMLDSKTKIDNNFSTQEFTFLQKFIFEAFILKEEKDHAKKQLGEITARVAHDLSNYLFNLNDCIIKTPNIPDQQREKMYGFIRDIDMMAADLLNKYSAKKLTSEKTSALQTLSITSQILKSIEVAKIKCDGQGIKLQAIIFDESYGLFAALNPSDFKRIFINLINNAIEAQPKSRVLSVELSQHEGLINIKIIDDGKGIPASILEKLGKEELTFGKSNGHGIGVYHAAQLLKAWGGNLMIESQVGVGTSVTLQLPLMPQPSYFLPELNLKDIEKIVIIDDDNTIHKQWNNKLGNFNIIIENFYSSQAAIDHFLQHPANEYTFFLVDYQFSNEVLTGVEVIKSLCLQKQAMLVTGRSDDNFIIDTCIEQGIKLLAKNNMPFLKII